MEIIKSNIKKVYYWVIVLAVIVALALVYIYTQNRKSSLTEAQKQDILNNLVQSSTANLTDQQKLNALKQLSSGKSNVSAEDRQRILQSVGQ
jgi:hypothetical protein